MKNIIYVVLFVFLLSGCKGDNVDIAKKQVGTFRYMYDINKFNDIYKNSADKMKKSVSHDDFVAFIVSEKAEIGQLNKTQLTNSNSISYVIGEPAVVLTYSSEYSKKKVREVFSFVSESGELKLSGYSYTTTN